MKNDEESIPKTPGGILVRIRDKITLVLGITPPTLKLLIDRFVQTSFSRTSIGAHSEKINYYKQLTKNEMTIKTFFRFLRIIDIRKVSITVALTTSRGKKVSVVEDIDLLGASDEENDNA